MAYGEYVAVGALAGNRVEGLQAGLFAVGLGKLEGEGAFVLGGEAFGLEVPGEHLEGELLSRGPGGGDTSAGALDVPGGVFKDFGSDFYEHLLQCYRGLVDSTAYEGDSTLGSGYVVVGSGNGVAHDHFNGVEGQAELLRCDLRHGGPAPLALLDCSHQHLHLPRIEQLRGGRVCAADAYSPPTGPDAHASLPRSGGWGGLGAGAGLSIGFPGLFQGGLNLHALFQVTFQCGGCRQPGVRS